MIGSLYNIGNTCFVNTILQCLLHAPPFRKLLHQGHSSTCLMKTKQQQSSWCGYCAIQKIYMSTLCKPVTCPSPILSNMIKLSRKYRFNKQEDSHQFLRHLIEKIQISDIGGKIEPKSLENQKIEKSKIFGIFGGKIQSIVECANCSHRSITNEHYYDLSLECQKSDNIQDSIQSFFKTDRINGYVCEKCKQVTQVTKWFRLKTQPQILTLHLKRFTNQLTKIQKMMNFPHSLSLKDFSDCANHQYQLYAVAVHRGWHYYGHYYALVKIDSQWYQMNDTYIAPIQETEVLKEQAYILMYKRKINTFSEQLQTAQIKAQSQLNQLAKQCQYQGYSINSPAAQLQKVKKVSKIIKKNILLFRKHHRGLHQGIMRKHKK